MHSTTNCPFVPCGPASTRSGAALATAVPACSCPLAVSSAEVTTAAPRAVYFGSVGNGDRIEVDRHRHVDRRPGRRRRRIGHILVGAQLGQWRSLPVDLTGERRHLADPTGDVEVAGGPVAAAAGAVARRQRLEVERRRGGELVGGKAVAEGRDVLTRGGDGEVGLAAVADDVADDLVLVRVPEQRRRSASPAPGSSVRRTACSTPRAWAGRRSDLPRGTAPGRCRCGCGRTRGCVTRLRTPPGSRIPLPCASSATSIAGVSVWLFE